MVLTAEIDGLPREVWPDEFSRRKIRPVRNRGEAAGMEAVDTGPPLFTEGIERGGSNWPPRSIAQVVESKRVGDQKDNVFHDAVAWSDRLFTLVEC